MNTKEIITNLGGTAYLANILERNGYPIKQSTIRSWINRDSIPKYWIFNIVQIRKQIGWEVPNNIVNDMLKNKKN